MRNHFIIGVDEVGRGPLLGDVVVAAAILPSACLVMQQADATEVDLPHADAVGLVANHELNTLTDSKKLSEKKRELLFGLIEQAAVAYHIAKIPPAVIDDINILQATLLGMKTAIAAVITGINQRYTEATFSVVVDGNRLPDLADLPTRHQIVAARAIVKGDGRHVTISAASVLAKVSRDRDMRQLAKQYPAYAIEKHKGYPTAVHLQAISEHGILPMHRRSFAPIKTLLADNASR